MQYPSAVQRATVFCALAFASGTVVLAQDTTPQPATLQPGTLPSKLVDDLGTLPFATPVEAAPNEKQFGVDVHTQYFIQSLTSPQSVGRIAITTAFGEIGSSSDPRSYAERFASRYGEQLIRRSVQLAIGAARGEDPRFRRSGKEGFWPRTSFVLSRTVVADMSNGGTSIAAARLTGLFAGNALAAAWDPRNPSMFHQGLTGTGINIAGDLGLRMLKEFWPEIKRTFKK